jgi:hypothetical protein
VYKGASDFKPLLKEPIELAAKRPPLSSEPSFQVIDTKGGGDEGLGFSIQLRDYFYVSTGPQDWNFAFNPSLLCSHAIIITIIIIKLWWFTRFVVLHSHAPWSLEPLALQLQFIHACTTKREIEDVFSLIWLYGAPGNLLHNFV